MLMFVLFLFLAVFEAIQGKCLTCLICMLHYIDCGYDCHKIYLYQVVPWLALLVAHIIYEVGENKAFGPWKNNLELAGLVSWYVKTMDNTDVSLAEPSDFLMKTFRSFCGNSVANFEHCF